MCDKFKEMYPGRIERGEDKNVTANLSRRAQNDTKTNCVHTNCYNHFTQRRGLSMPSLPKSLKYKNRQWLLANIRRLQYAPFEYLDDHHFIIAAIGQLGSEAFLKASQRLQDDFKFIDGVIHHTSVDIFQYVAHHYENDQENVRYVLQHNPCMLQYASKAFRDDESLVIIAIELDPMTLEFASESIKNNADIVKRAVSINPNALEFASDELKNDDDVVMCALNTTSLWKHLAFSFASRRIQSDISFLSKEIEMRPSSLQYTSQELCDNEDIISKALKCDGWSLVYASERLRGKYEVVLLAVKNNGHALQYASDELRNNREIVLSAVQNQGIALQYASSILQDDTDIVLQAIDNDVNALEYASFRFRDNRVIGLGACYAYTWMKQCLSSRLQNDSEIISLSSRVILDEGYLLC